MKEGRLTPCEKKRFRGNGTSCSKKRVHRKGMERYRGKKPATMKNNSKKPRLAAKKKKKKLFGRSEKTGFVQKEGVSDPGPNKKLKEETQLNV